MAKTKKGTNDKQREHRHRGPRRQLNMREAAEYMGRSIRWMRGHSVELPEGHPWRIPYWKTAPNQQGHVMFDRADLDAYIERMYEEAGA